MKLSSNVSKEAIYTFQLILCYMGEKKNEGQSPTQMCSLLVEKAIQHVELRDEIYSQLIKQTNENPTIESLRKGWELWTVCCSSFPPTKQFEGFIKNYVESHITRHDRIGKFARHCLTLLEDVCQHGARSSIPSAEEIDTMRV